ncbi:hypothetical protein L5515_016658 [Caenorhabditis briggsae]|uniref:Peptidase M13 N-terminal domain-containing protein n=1 Tax=Caenorhabditis briggsae TaxID=6238 RepID=A0AAE9FC76_CAEBR|nr:hypothetical protein L5515_016658 [Caenorhabditis briggsae]
MWWLQASILILLAVSVLCEDQTLDPNAPTACNNFYEYVCEKPLDVGYPRLKAVLWSQNNLSNEIDQYQDYVFHPQQKLRFWDVANADVISKWLVQFDTNDNGVKWKEHTLRHEEFLTFEGPEKREALEKIFENYNLLKFQVITRFYKSLKKSVEHLEDLHVPVSSHNHYYHGIFDEIVDIHISQIRSESKYNEEQKNYLIDRVKKVKIIFPYLEYNNITVWRQAKTAYEKEYYRLNAVINETRLHPDVVDKMIRVLAVNQAMEIFEKYITTFTPRFVFQHVVSAATRHSFNYQDEIHLSIFTVFNPKTNPNAVYDRILYVMCHELLHVHYNVDPPPFETEIWDREKQCIHDRLDYYANAYKNESDWSLAQFSYEDSANVSGLRLMLLYLAQMTSDSNQIRENIENVVTRFCHKTQRKAAAHNPLDVSLNVAVSQMPTFNSLYNCTPGDRMYVARDKYCKALNMDIDVNDYLTQKVEKDDLFVLTQFMDVLENTADELDAANITTIEYEKFDVTVTNVEEEEEALEGSAESSESSLESKESSEEEGGDLEDDLKEAESLASLSSSFSFKFIVILVFSIYLL